MFQVSSRSRRVRALITAVAKNFPVDNDLAMLKTRLPRKVVALLASDLHVFVSYHAVVSLSECDAEWFPRLTMLIDSELTIKTGRTGGRVPIANLMQS